MSINPAGAVGVPLVVFGSWCTEVPPESVPENISPDCQDVSFVPGGVQSRPALDTIVFTPALSPNSTCTYGKSFVTPTGDIKNLYLFSNGSFYVEDLTNSPQTATLLFTTTPESYCRSVTSFGREFISISDGLHGVEKPLQYDGANVDIVTSDGPGTPPTVANLIIPATALAAITTFTGTVTFATPTNQQSIGGVLTYTQLFVQLSSYVGIPQSGLLTISGNSLYNPTSVYYQLAFNLQTQQINGLVISNQYNAANTPGTGGSATISGSVTLSRVNNIVTATTSSAHGLKIGYQAQISKTTAAPLGDGIASIVINNEDNPGIALITTNTEHGLVPENFAIISDVDDVSVGGGVASSIGAGDTVTVTTNSAHGLVVGSIVNIKNLGGAPHYGDGQWTVTAIPSPTQFTYDIPGSNLSGTSGGASGTVTLQFPLAPSGVQNDLLNTFQVLECPTPTSFQVAITYGDGTWASGTVSFSWDGTFYVSAVLSTTAFQYQQYGPTITSDTSGTVTPNGQAAPGLHLMQVLWLTRQGAIPAPSPPVTVLANGGQYLAVSNIPIGPSYVTGRILAFTGAQPNVPGELPPFFYIPTTPQLEGQIVGTSTQINDNTTTNVLLDFSDNTLFAAIGISIPGNNLANQIVLDGTLGFGEYETRLTTWGQRNVVQNLLNMGFGGGSLPSTPTLPTGWNYIKNTGGTLTSGRFGGQAWEVPFFPTPGPSTVNGRLFQSLYEDAYGAPIADGNTLYSIRLYLTRNAADAVGQFVATITSASTGFISTATFGTIPSPAIAEWVECTFSAKTPVAIPSDLILTIGFQSLGGTAQTFTAQFLQLINADNPYTDTIAYGSYVDNPEGMDGVSGKFGPSDDSNKLMDMAILRDTLFLLTQAPSGRLHETNGSNVSEPAGWTIAEVAANCGTISAFGLTHSQADDTAASGGDDWMAWPSEGGAMIFGGGQPEKISQEIQPNWYDPTKADTSIQINMAAAKTVWSVNDPVQRLVFFGVPIGEATAPNKIYVLNYRNLNSASAIASSPPFHPSFAGKLIATDNSRKWNPWNMTMNGAARMYRAPGQLSLVMLGGNGQTPNVSGYGNVYLLNPAKLTDDDYGQIFPYYVTYAFLDPEKAQGLQLKGGRIMLAYLMAYIQGVGNITASYYPDSLSNLWPLKTVRALTNVFFDREFGGGQCYGNRIFIKLASSPVTGTDNSFSLTRLTAFFKDHRMIVGGRNQ